MSESRNRQLEDASSVTAVTFASWPETVQVIYLESLPVEQLARWCATNKYMQALCKKHGQLRKRLLAAKRAVRRGEIEAEIEHMFETAVDIGQPCNDVLRDYRHFIRQFRELWQVTDDASTFEYHTFFVLLWRWTNILNNCTASNRANPSVPSAAREFWSHLIEAEMPDAVLQRKMREVIQEIYRDANLDVDAEENIRYDGIIIFDAILSAASARHYNMFRSAALEVSQEGGYEQLSEYIQLHRPPQL